MTRSVLPALLFVLLCAPAGRANMASNEFTFVGKPPEPKPGADYKPLVAGVATAVGVGCAGFWLLRRRTKPEG